VIRFDCFVGPRQVFVHSSEVFATVFDFAIEKIIFCKLFVRVYDPSVQLFSKDWSFVVK
jgi:hypothetical protein